MQRAFGFFVAVFLSLAHLSVAGELCIRALHSNLNQVSPENARYYDHVLAETESFLGSQSVLHSATDSRLKEKFKTTANLPLDAKAYRNTRFVLSGQGRKVQAGEERIFRVDFGYTVSGSFKPIGTLTSVLVGADGNVLEIEGSSQELLDEFKAHLFGRALTAEEQRIRSEINLKLIDFLRSVPEYQNKVAEFSKSRGWPAGLSDEARLAYCDRDLKVLTNWATENGYSLKQLRDAGWLKMSFDRSGVPRYSVWASGIRIPFFVDDRQSGVVGFRTRILAAPSPDYPKYLSGLKDRALDEKSSLNEWFYGIWNVTHPIERLVITEGEFKSLVATRLASIPTVGMLGITNYTPQLLKDLAKLPVKEFVIIFDRDPDGKGLMRANGVTDSQRGAYQLAVDMRDAGATNVKIGILPDAFGDGRKVGIDDLILAKGADPYRAVVESALKPEDFAKEMGLDSRFQEINHRRQMLRRALEQYENSLRRGGSRVDASTLQESRRILSILEEANRRYLKQQLDANSLFQSSSRFDFLAPTAKLDRDHALHVRSSSSQGFRAQDFSGQTLLMDFVTIDVDEALIEGQRTVEFPFTDQQLRDGFEDGSLRTSEEYLRGLEIAQKSGARERSFEMFKAILLAGYLSRTFPADDYVFNFDVSIQRRDDAAHLVQTERVPLVIRKKEGTVVALAELHSPTFEKPAKWLNRVKRLLRAL